MERQTKEILDMVGGEADGRIQINLEKRSNGEREAYMQGWKAGFEAGKRQMK